MKFYNISNPKKFLNKVLDCSGSVCTVEPDGKAQDMKQMAQFLINTGMADQIGSIAEIQITLDNSDDMLMLMQYAAGMNCESSAA